MASVLNLATGIVPAGISGPVQFEAKRQSDTPTGGRTLQMEDVGDVRFSVRLWFPGKVGEHVGVAEGTIDHLLQYVHGKVGSQKAPLPEQPASSCI